MRKPLLAFMFAAGASLFTLATSYQVSAAGPAMPRDAIGASEGVVTRVDYYRGRRYCCGPRYHRRRLPVYGYYAPPAYYPPPVVYYPPPIVYYPPPVVYGAYAPVAPYRAYGIPAAAYYRGYYGW
jgi:hypothetical protein